MHELRLAADEGFVRLDGPAHLCERLGLHGAPDAVVHKPRRRLRDTERPPQFVGTDAVLGIGEQPDCWQPLVEPDGAILKDGPELHGELPPAFAAFPDAAGLEEAGVFRFARGTGHAVRPAQRGQESQRHVFVREVLDGFVERIGEMFGLWHGLNLLQDAWCVNCVIALVRQQPRHGARWFIAT